MEIANAKSLLEGSPIFASKMGEFYKPEKGFENEFLLLENFVYFFVLKLGELYK